MFERVWSWSIILWFCMDGGVWSKLLETHRCVVCWLCSMRCPRHMSAILQISSKFQRRAMQILELSRIIQLFQVKIEPRLLLYSSSSSSSTTLLLFVRLTTTSSSSSSSLPPLLFGLGAILSSKSSSSSTISGSSSLAAMKSSSSS